MNRSIHLLSQFCDWNTPEETKTKQFVITTMRSIWTLSIYHGLLDYFSVSMYIGDIMLLDTLKYLDSLLFGIMVSLAIIAPMLTGEFEAIGYV